MDSGGRLEAGRATEKLVAQVGSRGLAPLSSQPGEKRAEGLGARRGHLEAGLGGWTRV